MVSAANEESTPRPGRKSKGERGFISVRPPVGHLAVYQERAESMGLSLSDYVVLALAQSHDLPVPDYIIEELEKVRTKREAERSNTGAQQLDFPVSKRLQRGRPLARSA